MTIGCFCFSKQESFQLLNAYHNNIFDTFFINFTWFGDGLISIVAVILLSAFNQRKQAMILLLAYISSGITAQLLKHAFNHPRPKLFFEQSKISFHFIENIRIYTEDSFPSGHTASAFAMATVFSLFNYDKRFSLLALLLAAMEGYSRVYLGQHFLEDLAAGAFIGILFGMIGYYAITLNKNFLTSGKQNPVTRNNTMQPDIEQLM
jgi:membrane-associated phospholipid phosphatase